MKLAYWFSRRQLGKVITPLKTMYVRLPLAFTRWIGSIQSLEKKLPLPEELRVLLRIYVAQINTCHFCIDIGQAHAIRSFTNPERFNEVRDFETSPQFSETERVALRFARELTTCKKVPDDLYRAARRHFSEEQVIGIAWMVSSEHVYNLMNLAFEIESDGLCKMPVRRVAKVSD